MNMKKMKIKITMILLILLLICLHVHASSNPKELIHSVDNKKEFVEHKNGVSPVVRRGGGGGGHGGGHGSVGGGHGGGGVDPRVVIPIYAAGRRAPIRHGRNNSEHNAAPISQLVSTIFALVFSLTYCF
ncbi:hypothetical protein R6Q57_023967 [Mikania cordata]